MYVKATGLINLENKTTGVRHVRPEGPPDLEVEHRKLSDLRLDDDNMEELNMFFRGLTYVTNYLFKFSSNFSPSLRSTPEYIIPSRFQVSITYKRTSPPLISKINSIQVEVGTTVEKSPRKIKIDTVHPLCQEQ
jgi:hypothetical protein